MLRQECPNAGIGTLTGLFGYRRQSFYNRVEENEFAENAIEPLIVEKAKDYRKDNPGLGCAKLYLVIRDIVPSRPNEIWVSDITYVETGEGVCYLSLITDAYSHMIVGWALGPTLETVYPLEALRMALATIDDETAAMLIHHSDRGCQYCSQTYVQELKRHRVSISMTQSGDPLENAVAERANGILKTEWLYKMTIPTIEVCRQELKRIILLYNTRRPHMSIGMQTPVVAHAQTGEQKRCWRNPWENRAATPPG